MTTPEKNPFSAHERKYVFEPWLQEGYRDDIKGFCETLARLPKGSTLWYEWTKYPEAVAFARPSNESLRSVSVTDCPHSAIRVIVSGRQQGLIVPIITGVFGIGMYDLVTYVKGGWFQLQTDGRILV